MNFDFFCKKCGLQIQTAITFAYDLGKKSITYQNDHHKIWKRFQQPTAVLDFFRFSKFQREIWKQKNFRFCQEKMENFDLFLKFLNFFCCFFYFLIILNFLYYFRILEFFKFFFFKLSFKINNWILHKDYYYLIIVAYF